jgi:hypothetical protein
LSTVSFILSVELVATRGSGAAVSIEPFGPLSWIGSTMPSEGLVADSSDLAPVWWALIGVAIAAVIIAGVVVCFMVLRRQGFPAVSEPTSRDNSFDFSCDPSLLMEPRDG